MKYPLMEMNVPHIDDPKFLDINKEIKITNWPINTHITYLSRLEGYFYFRSNGINLATQYYGFFETPSELEQKIQNFKDIHDFNNDFEDKLS